MNTRFIRALSTSLACRHFALAWLLLGMLSCASRIQAQLQWEQIYPKSAVETMNDVTFDGTRFLAAGTHGTIIESSDGTNWNTLVSDYNDNSSTLQSIAVGGGQVVAVGSGFGLYSYDGEHWFHSTGLENLSNQVDVAYGNGRFVSVGERIAYATQTGHWELSDFTPTNRLTAITYGESAFVAVGLEGQLLYSTNGIQWTVSTNLFPPNFYDVTYGEDKFVAVGFGFISLSENGRDWQRFQITHLESLEHVVYGQGQFLAASDDSVFTSIDGRSWTQALFNKLSLKDFGGIVYGNGIFVALGRDEFGLFTSTDGKVWAEIKPPHSIRIASEVAQHFSGDLLVFQPASGNTNFQISVNGSSWNSYNSPATRGLHDVTFAYNSIFVGLIADGKIATSVNGINWRVWPVPGTHVNSLVDILAGPFGKIFIVSSNGKIFSNTEEIINNPGAPWTELSSPTTNLLMSMTEGGGVLVAVGQNEIINSSDGTNWTNVFRTTNSVFMRNVAYGQNRFVVVGQTDNNVWVMLTSTNGVDWEQVIDVPQLSDIAYGNGCFVGVGGNSVYESPDGVVWRKSASLIAAPYRLFSVYFLKSGTPNSGRFYVSGNFGTIFRSGLPGPRLANISCPASDLLRLNLEAEIGHNYRLESSTNLMGWNTFKHLGTLTNPVTSIEVSTDDHSQKFFRIVRD